MKLIIAGSRDFDDYQLLERKVDFYLSEIDDNVEVEIVSGTAKGVDTLGEIYAKKRGFKIKKFPADWDRFGRSAGIIRNKEMAKYGSHCICFWNGKSRGTKSMIDISKEHGLIYRIVLYNDK